MKLRLEAVYIQNYHDVKAMSYVETKEDGPS
jgi:hypothetical protein